MTSTVVERRQIGSVDPVGDFNELIKHGMRDIGKLGFFNLYGLTVYFQTKAEKILRNDIP